MTAATAYMGFMAASLAVYAFLTRRLGRKAAFKQFATRVPSQNQRREYSGAMPFVLVHAAGFVITTAGGMSGAIAGAASILAPCSILLGVRYREHKSRRKMRSQVEGVLSGLSSSLYSNPSLGVALADIAARSEDPIGRQLAIANLEIAHGSSIDDALRGAAQRIDDEVFAFAVDAIAICRATGADICVVLDRLSKLSGMRGIARAKVEALTSQQKTTAKLVTVIPVCLLSAVNLLNPTYTAYLLTHIGQVVVIYAALSISGGFFVMHRMAARVSDDI